ncbi:UDP-N-acetyl-2-amino-2-deoxyglucuronate dehydrogenase [Azospirillaceae bacterium]
MTNKTENTAPTSFALMGCGRIAHKHAGLLSQGSIPDARLVAVCDVRPERAQEIGTLYNAPWYTNVHEMMAKQGDNIDVLSILTESGNHAAHLLETVRYRKHFVVEKPMALSLDHADAMIAACDRAGVKLFVVKQNRFNLPVRKLMDALTADRLGKLVMGSVRVRWCRTQAYYDQDAWRGTWALDGGVLANQASHHIDLLLWCMGEPESVMAMTTTGLVNIETEDTAAAVVRFRSGALGIIEATTATRPKDMEGSISVLGSTGVVEIGGFALNEMKTWQFTESQPGDEDVLGLYRTNPPNVYGFGHVEYLNHVVVAIRGSGRSLVDGLEGRKSLEMIQAIYESVESKREVALRFRPSRSRLGRSNEQKAPTP